MRSIMEIIWGRPRKIIPINVNKSLNKICTCSRYHFYGNCSHILSVY